jgi:glycosyltransferase involved in cell wall biosynthesis
MMRDENYGEKASQPLVSCIMPTYNRREFVPQAIHYFLRQDYEPKELIIIDDGTDVIEGLVPADKRIRYYRLNEKITLGAKLNMACQYAKGSIIAHWDDDDWYAARRLTYQVETLMQEGTDICGINRLLYFDIRGNRAYQYIYPTNQRTWLLGSTLCYIKKHWSGSHFAEIDVGMDGLFVWAARPDRITTLQDTTFAVFMIHPHNVSPKKTEGTWWHPYPVEEIRKILDSDWAFYRPEPAEPRPLSPMTITVNKHGDDKIEKPAKMVRNIFACLVHESQECVVDLVRNLKYLDPTSQILLYNGGTDKNLLKNFPFEQYGAVVIPDPRPLKWGYLHDFALDCMQFALDNFSFDTLTIVDSDQLGVRAGYSDYLGQCISSQADVGMLGNAPDPQPSSTSVPPALQAFKEIDLWRPFLQRFPQGEEKFVHWTFWPSTVFMADAVRDLTGFFATDENLGDIMRRSSIWATEEIILPTIVTLLGYKIAKNPCSYDYVKYKESYTTRDVDRAFNSEDVFWVHPITRKYDNSLRKHIRDRFNHYIKTGSSESMVFSPGAKGLPGMLLTTPILEKMKKVEGWLEEDEADLLIAACRHAFTELPQIHSIVEVGSYCGRSTIVIGSVVKAISPEVKIYAIDPHDGRIGALDQGIRKAVPTLEKFRLNIAREDITDVVETIKEYPYKVSFKKPISLLFIDGLHDYVNVARDFFHFEPWVVSGGFIIFHDYADYYPGVKAFVDEILGSGEYREVHRVSSLIVIQKLPNAETSFHKECPLQFPGHNDILKSSNSMKSEQTLKTYVII